MENNEQNQQPSIISLIGSDDEIQMQFADGLKLIPPRIVFDLGKTYFEERSEAFKKINYADFLNGYTKMQQKQILNRFQDEIVANHFNRT